jgi:hypothetical protein
MTEIIENIEATEDDDDTIHIGWEKIKVYPNLNGDICIAQENPIEGREVVICIPKLYWQTFINYVNRACDED